MRRAETPERKEREKVFETCEADGCRATISKNGQHGCENLDYITRFYVPDGGPGRFSQYGVHQYPRVGDLAIPLVHTVFKTTENMQMRRLRVRDPRISQTDARFAL